VSVRLPSELPAPFTGKSFRCEVPEESGDGSEPSRYAVGDEVGD
jgi:hypothetical protein